MRQPLITIITVSYKAVSTIEKTILSVIEQTYQNIEYIIIDGCSADGTIDIIKKYEDKITKWISEPDKGIYDAMNKGIQLASGNWINFMNCGDSFYSTHSIQQIVEYISKNEYVDVIYGNSIINFMQNKYLVLPENLDKITNHLPFCHQCAFVKTSLAKQYPFDLKYKFVADYNFFYQIFNKKGSFLYVNQAVANYQIDDGFTANNAKQCIEENYLVNRKKISIFKRWELILRNTLLKTLPKFITNYIKVLLYKRNTRFVILK